MLVTEDRLEDLGLEQALASLSAGAIVTFSGNVRNHDHGRQVVSLHYEAHPSAQRVLEEVARELAQKHDVEALTIAHRVGAISMGESALLVVVAASHRGEAFELCRAAVDLTKEKLPVWKHQVFDDGTDEWVNCA